MVPSSLWAINSLPLDKRERIYFFKKKSPSRHFWGYIYVKMPEVFPITHSTLNRSGDALIEVSAVLKNCASPRPLGESGCGLHS